METAKDLAQIHYYVTLSVAGPPALTECVKAERRDRLANEYKVSVELDDRSFEYQKIALQYYDLDILDVPNNDASLGFDKKRKQEMVAYAILFSLFERAFLMFHPQAQAFQPRQWWGWNHFPNDDYPPGERPKGLAAQQGDVRHRLPALHGRADRRNQNCSPAAVGRAVPTAVARQSRIGRPAGCVTAVVGP